jgi:hypothetical protein
MSDGYDLLRAALDAREEYATYESDEDESSLVITEAELHELVAAHRHADALLTQMFEELEYRARNSESSKFASGDDDDRQYARFIAGLDDD